MFLPLLPDPQLTVVDQGKKGMEYRVAVGKASFRTRHRYPRIFSGVAKDGTLWIVHGNRDRPYVRVLNPQLGIDTTSVLLKFNPYGWWKLEGKRSDAPTPEPSPVRWNALRVLTPGLDAVSGYSAALSVPHEDGTASQVFLVKGPGGRGHVFAVSPPLKPGQTGPIDRFAEKPGVNVKAQMLKPNSPLYFQITLPGTVSKLASAHVAVRVVGRQGQPLLFALDPLHMNPRRDVPVFEGDGGEYQSVGMMDPALAEQLMKRDFRRERAIPPR